MVNICMGRRRPASNTCGRGRWCITSGRGGRRPGATTATGTARPSASTAIATMTTGCTTSWCPLRWRATGLETPLPELRDDQEKYMSASEHALPEPTTTTPDHGPGRGDLEPVRPVRAVAPARGTLVVD